MKNTKEERINNLKEVYKNLERERLELISRLEENEELSEDYLQHITMMEKELEEEKKDSPLTMQDLEEKYITMNTYSFPYFAVFVKVPEADQPEIIVNHRSEMKRHKYDYYRNSYDNFLRHNFNNQVRIVDIKVGRLEDIFSK